MNLLIADANSFRSLGIQTLIKECNHDAVFQTVNNEWKLFCILHGASFTHIVLNTSIAKRSLNILISKIKQVQKHVKVLVISESSERIFPQTFINSHADGIIGTEASIAHFESGLKSFFQHGLYIPESMEQNNEDLLMRFKDREISIPQILSHNEWFVIEKLLLGLKICEIAKTMKLSSSTVSTYKLRGFKKLNVRTLSELVSLLSTSKKLA